MVASDYLMSECKLLVMIDDSLLAVHHLQAVTSNYLKKKSEKHVLQADFGSKPQIKSDGFVMLNVLSVCLHTIMKINSKTTSSMQII